MIAVLLAAGLWLQFSGFPWAMERMQSVRPSVPGQISNPQVNYPQFNHHTR